MKREVLSTETAAATSVARQAAVIAHGAGPFFFRGQVTDAPRLLEAKDKAGGGNLGDNMGLKSAARHRGAINNCFQKHALPLHGNAATWTHKENPVNHNPTAPAPPSLSHIEDGLVSVCGRLHCINTKATTHEPPDGENKNETLCSHNRSHKVVPTE